jgi:hypothetical protein
MIVKFFSRKIMILLILVGAVPCLADDQDMADAHLHYNQSHSDQLDQTQILEILQRNNIELAVVTSIPASISLELQKAAPEKIIPLLGVYTDYEDKQNWHRQTNLANNIEQAITSGAYRGIGELHLFAEHRYSPVFMQLVTLATRHHLPLLMHCDPVVIDTLFDHEPRARVVWAHAGAYPYPALLRDYLARYPDLYIDLSMRNERIAPDNQLDSEWENLFMEFPGRFMTGVDTFSARRWHDYGHYAEQTRSWLDQLPDEVSRQIRIENTRRVYQNRE